eukprot:7841974-Pyramimonas_sp.AAC.1
MNAGRVVLRGELTAVVERLRSGGGPGSAGRSNRGDDRVAAMAATDATLPSVNAASSSKPTTRRCLRRL